MTDFLEENKSAIKIAGILIGVTVILVIINSVVTNIVNAPTPKKLLTSLATTYYEDEYYNKLVDAYPEEYNIILKKHEKEGLKISIKDFITIYKKIDLAAFDRNKYSMCDFDLTYVTIYPKSPYEVDDYELKITEYCIDPKATSESEDK